jgi:glucose-6-phosphate 1-dehydrogenase
MRLFIDREDWYNVPIYIRTGKELHEKHTYIVIELKKFPFQSEDEEPNRIVIELQPDERVNIMLINKHEDIQEYQEIKTVDSIACEGNGCLAEHGVLFLDVMNGDKVHFLSFEEIIAAWDVIDVVERMIQKQKIKVATYKKGSDGPSSQDKLPAHDNFAWFDVH